MVSSARAMARTGGASGVKAGLGANDAPRICGKDDNKRCTVSSQRNLAVENPRQSGQKSVIFEVPLGAGTNLWHSTSRSSRSTCRRSCEPKGKRDEGERGLARGTEPPGGQRSSVRCSYGQWREVPAVSWWSVRHGPAGNVPRKPRGAGGPRPTGHSGFSAVRALFHAM